MKPYFYQLICYKHHYLVLQMSQIYPNGLWILAYIFNMGSNHVLADTYFDQGDKWWVGLTIAFIISALGAYTLFFIYTIFMYVNNIKCNKFKIWLAFAVFNLTPVTFLVTCQFTKFPATDQVPLIIVKSQKSSPVLTQLFTYITENDFFRYLTISNSQWL